MLILLPCPDCGYPAEVTDRFALNSTDGPVDHVALQCAGGHHFRMPVDALAVQSQEQLGAPRAMSSAPQPADAATGIAGGRAVGSRDAGAA